MNVFLYADDMLLYIFNEIQTVYAPYQELSLFWMNLHFGFSCKFKKRAWSIIPILLNTRIEKD